MFGEDATGLVGVISIDEAEFEPATDSSLGCGGVRDDATLALALVRLAARDDLSRGHFAGRLAPFWATSARVTANLVGLAAELEQAVAQALRRIAASR